MSRKVWSTILSGHDRTLKRRVNFMKGDFIEPIPKWYGDRGVFGGGWNGSSYYNVIDYITISALGNAQDFGDLTEGRRRGGGVSDGSRGCFGGGYSGSNLNVIDYITISTLGNAQDFGDLTVARENVSSGVSDGSRGCFGGGYSPASNVIDYITISTLGNAQDFGDLTVARQLNAGVSDGSRGCFGGGYDGGSTVNVIDYITISTLGNAQDFGDLTVARGGGVGGVSDSSRGCFGGGLAGTNDSSAVNVIDYITITSLGNAQDFGDLTVARSQIGGASNGDDERGVFAGGIDTGSTVLNLIDYITISSLGSASDFGDLVNSRGGVASLSGD